MRRNLELMNVENYLEEQKVGAHLGSVSGPTLPMPSGETVHGSDRSPIPTTVHDLGISGQIGS